MIKKNTLNGILSGIGEEAANGCSLFFLKFVIKFEVEEVFDFTGNVELIELFNKELREVFGSGKPFGI